MTVMLEALESTEGTVVAIECHAEEHYVDNILAVLAVEENDSEWGASAEFEAGNNQFS